MSLAVGDEVKVQAEVDEKGKISLDRLDKPEARRDREERRPRRQSGARKTKLRLAVPSCHHGRRRTG